MTILVAHAISSLGSQVMACTLALLLSWFAADMHQHGFEHALKYGQPLNPNPWRYKMTVPCCKIKHTGARLWGMELESLMIDTSPVHMSLPTSALLSPASLPLPLPSAAPTPGMTSQHDQESFSQGLVLQVIGFWVGIWSINSLPHHCACSHHPALHRLLSTPFS